MITTPIYERLLVVLLFGSIICLVGGYSDVHFSKLEQYLESNDEIDCTDADKCLEEAKKLLLADESRDTERSAIRLLADAPESVECSPHFVQYVVRLAEETQFGQEKPLVDKLATHVVRASVEHCQPLVEALVEKVEQTMNWLQDKEGVSTGRLSKLKNGFVQKHTYFAVGRPSFMIDPQGWAQIIKLLADGDPKNRFTRTLLKQSPGLKNSMLLIYPDPNNFSYIYENYLNEPCEQHNNHLAELMRKIQAIRFYALKDHEKAKHMPNLFKELPDSFQDIAYRYYVCDQVLTNGINRESVITSLAN